MVLMSDQASRTGALDAFSAPVRTWFTDVFDAPTPAQDGAWRAIAGRRNALVIAPTGSGKTLAAFLAALDRVPGIFGIETGGPGTSAAAVGEG